jgi:hypothetical protein
MKWTWLALLITACSCTAARAQPVLVPVPVVPYAYQGGGYINGGGVGFAYQRGNLAIGGFIGTRYVAGAGVVGPFVPGPYGPVGPIGYPLPYPGYSSSRIIVNNYFPAQQRLPRTPSLQDEVAGVDLDLVPPKKSKPEEPPAQVQPPPPKPADVKQPEPEPDFQLPGGVDVSKPKEPVRPADLPRPKPKLKVQAPTLQQPEPLAERRIEQPTLLFVARPTIHDPRSTFASSCCC